MFRPEQYKRKSGSHEEPVDSEFIVNEFRVENDWRASIFVHKW